MEIRDLLPGDIAQITEIYNHHVLNTTVLFETEPYSEDDMTRKLQEIMQSYPLIVGEEDGCVVGFAYAHSWKSKPAYNTTVESTLYIREDKKSKGYGSELLKELIKRCRKAGFHAMIACITAENSESVIFHESHGFRQASRFCQVGRKFGRWLDVVDYELIL
ncbi:MAG: N-acetyltransferase [Paramuribaculum sp.]|nr:N-acetyltransferase [Paramuribaculum sp.]